MTARDVEPELVATASIVVAIWPAADWLPANILRFYIQFSAPAEAAFEREQVRLIAAGGELVPDAFLLLNEELWSPDGRRLTVLMEPGRIKRGMGPDSAHTPALIPHRSYRLEVSTGGRVFTKAFGVLQPILQPLLETHWCITRPAVGSRSPLEITFDRVMDGAIVADEIQVQCSDGSRLEGIQSLTIDGRKLIFDPASCWDNSDYRLVLSRRLEDVCGNRLDEALDHLSSQPQRSRAGVVSFRPTL